MPSQSSSAELVTGQFCLVCLEFSVSRFPRFVVARSARLGIGSVVGRLAVLNAFALLEKSVGSSSFGSRLEDALLGRFVRWREWFWLSGVRQ